MSYENLLMYTAATPQYDDERDGWDGSIDANNPDNFKTKNAEEEEYIR